MAGEMATFGKQMHKSGVCLSDGEHHGKSQTRGFVKRNHIMAFRHRPARSLIMSGSVLPSEVQRKLGNLDKEGDGEGEWDAVWQTFKEYA